MQASYHCLAAGAKCRIVHGQGTGARAYTHATHKSEVSAGGFSGATSRGLGLLKTKIKRKTAACAGTPKFIAARNESGLSLQEGKFTYPKNPSIAAAVNLASIGVFERMLSVVAYDFDAETNRAR